MDAHVLFPLVGEIWKIIPIHSTLKKYFPCISFNLGQLKDYRLMDLLS